MKQIAIDLHNHLLKTEYEYFEYLEQYFLKRSIHNLTKIFAITDHLEWLINFNDEKLNEYFEKISSITEKVNQKAIFIVLGIEIRFEINGTIKHLIILFDSTTACKSFISKCKSDGTSTFNFNNFGEYINDSQKAILIPHFMKERAFTKQDIVDFNKLKFNIKITTVETKSNWSTWKFACQELNDVSCNVIIGTDRWSQQHLDMWNKQTPKLMIPINYVYSNIAQNCCQVNCFDYVYDALTSNAGVSLSEKHGFDVTLQNTNFSINIENSIIYGERGSGKSFLANNLYECLCPAENIEYLRQFCFSKNEDATNNDLNKIMNSNKNIESFVSSLKAAFQSITNDKIISKQITDINSSSSIQIIDQWCEQYISNFIINITKNISNGNGIFLKHWCSIPEIPNSKILEVVDQINFINNFIKQGTNNLMKIINFIKDEQLLNLYVDTFIQICTELLKQFSNLVLLNEIYNETNKIIADINKQIKSNWEFNFDFNFYEYYYIKLMKKTTLDWIKYNLQNGITIKDDDPFSIHFDPQKDPKTGIYFLNQINFKNPKLVLTNEENVEASDGQKIQYLLWKQLNTKRRFIILDESEYSFDSKFISNDLADKLHKIISQGTKVFVITHNHILWSELCDRMNKEKIPFTFIKCQKNKKLYSYNQTVGLPNHSELLNTYESGEDSYDIRKVFYGKN